MRTFFIGKTIFAQDDENLFYWQDDLSTRRLLFLLPTSYFLLLTSYFSLPTSHFLLLTSYFLLPTSYFLLLTLPPSIVILHYGGILAVLIIQVHPILCLQVVGSINSCNTI